MMATIAARLLNVQVSNVVLGCLALAGALALGGAALTGDRKRELDKRRTDAIAALRSTVEEFRLSLAKQQRDASRALQQELRREAGAAAARRTAAVASELDTVRREAETDRCSAAELARIAADLTTLGELRRRALTIAAQLTPVPAAEDATHAVRRLHVVA